MIDEVELSSYLYTIMVVRNFPIKGICKKLGALARVL